jgi:hypothetical protein
MRSNACSRYALSASTSNQTHTAAGIFETSFSLRLVIHNPLGKTNRAWHRKSKVSQLPRELLKATGLFVNGLEF